MEGERYEHPQSPSCPRLHRARSEDYRANDRRESLILEKAALVEKLEKLTKEVGKDVLRTLEKKYDDPYLFHMPEPISRPSDDSTSQYLIINFGLIKNLRYHFANESVHEATGFLRLTVRSRNPEKKTRRWEDLLKTSTKEITLNGMVDDSIIVSVGGEGQKRGGSVELEIRGTLMGNLYSVASTVPFGSFKMLFPSSADMSDEMKTRLSAGEHVRFYVRYFRYIQGRDYIKPNNSLLSLSLSLSLYRQTYKHALQRTTNINIRYN